MVQQVFPLLGIFAMTLIVFYYTWSPHVKEIPEFLSPVQSNVCFVSMNDTRRNALVAVGPRIYFITPSYRRREQVPELTRLGQTLMHVPNLHWIVADDTSSCNSVITDLLLRFEIPFTHISSPMPDMYRSWHIIPKGVANRVASLKWLRENANSGVVYFGDDDNTYDLRLFEEIRSTKRVSVFPVGLVGAYGVSAPVVKEGRVVGFFDSWPANRRFALDMAGFAVTVEHLLEHTNATMPFRPVYEEDHYLRSLGVTLDMMEPKAENCTKVLVWHTETLKRPVPVLKGEQDADISLKDLLHELTAMGVVSFSNTSGKKLYMYKDGKETPL